MQETRTVANRHGHARLLAQVVSQADERRVVLRCWRGVGLHGNVAVGVRQFQEVIQRLRGVIRRQMRFVDFGWPIAERWHRCWWSAAGRRIAAGSGVKQRPGPYFGRFHVRLVEGIDPQDLSGHGGGDLPDHELLGYVVTVAQGDGDDRQLIGNLGNLLVVVLVAQQAQVDNLLPPRVPPWQRPFADDWQDAPALLAGARQ